MYFSGQGKILVAKLTNGVPGAFRWVGNVPEFSPKFETAKVEHKESWSGQKLTDKNLNTENKATFSATLQEWDAANVALATKGEVRTTADLDPVVDKVLPSALAVGDIVDLGATNLTGVSIKDSTGSPVTLTLGTHYSLDADFGTITILSLSGLTQPLKASYTPATDTKVVPFFVAGQQQYAVRFEGVNTADGNKKCLVELYKVEPDPTQELPLITEEFGEFVIEGNCLIDSSKANDPLFGQFGRLVYVED